MATRLKSFVPDATQALLLRACLEPDVSRAAAFGLDWLGRVEVVTVEPASARLLGLLYWRLAQAGVAHRELPRLKGIFRHTWAGNQVRLRQARPLLERLAQAGIPTLTLKGLPLAFSIYPDAGTRPMEDVDVLVPPARAVEAVRCLLAAGCRRLSVVPGARPGEDAEVLMFHNYAAHFQSAQGLHLDLHWHSLAECCAGMDDGFWERKVGWAAEGFSGSTLGLEDQLFHTCLHGARANILAPIRWIVDAACIVRKADGALRWPLLVEEARRRSLSYALAEALRVLEEIAPVGVPREVVAQLHAQARLPWERWEWQSNVSTRNWSKGAALWQRLARATPDEGNLRRLARFPTFLRARWGTASYPAMIGHLVRRLLAR